MTTLAGLADRIQTQLNDTAEATWKQDTIESFCIEAIRDYSTYFRRHAKEVITVSTAGQVQFTLPDDFRDATLVEFPVGEDPPRYLKRRSRTHPNFWQESGYYDYHRQPDARLPDPGNMLWLSDDDALTTDVMHVYYTAAHVTDLDPGDTISVPTEHEHILALFVIWKAYNERLAVEEQSPDTTIRMIQQMKLSVEAAERSYRAAVKAATDRSGAGGWTGPWKVDSHDRIY